MQGASQRVKEGSTPEHVYPVNHRAKAQAEIAAAFAAVNAAKAAAAARAAAGRGGVAGPSGVHQPAQSGTGGGDALGGDQQAAAETAAACFVPPAMTTHPLPSLTPHAASLASVRAESGAAAGSLERFCGGGGALGGADAGPTRVVTAAYLHGLIMTALLCRERIRTSGTRGAGVPEAWDSDFEEDEENDQDDLEGAVRRASRLGGQAPPSSPSSAEEMTPGRVLPAQAGSSAAFSRQSRSCLSRSTGIAPKKLAFLLGGEARLMGYFRQQQKRKVGPED